MPDARVGVVVVNWNGADDTIATLESLLTAEPRPAHVIVVDNGSADDSLVRLRAWIRRNATSSSEAGTDDARSIQASAWLFLLTASRNLGFSGANNVGLRLLAERTDVSHFLLLNNDATVAPDYFAQIQNAIADQPDAGLIGALIFRHPQREQIWFAGGFEIRSRALILHHVAPPPTDEPYATAFVTGCAMVISRALYQVEGGLDEVYNPIYWEDGDYSHRARARGCPIIVVPRAHVYHRVGASGGGERLTPRTAFFQNRNRAIYVRRNYRGVDRWVALLYLSVTKPARALVETARARGALGGAILRGFWRGLTERLV